VSGGPSTAWALASMAIAHVNGTIPLPREVVSAKADHWTLTLNNTNAPIDDLGPFEVRCASDKYVAVGIFGPAGGMIAGYAEERFIADMQAVVPRADWEAMLA